VVNRLFVIGSSAGGIPALIRVLEDLPGSFPAPLFVVQHFPPTSPGIARKILSKACALRVLHPRSGDPIRPGYVYVAPPNRHLLVRKGHVALSDGPRENLVRPSIDALFRSAALAYGAAVVGVILTGALNDGTAGLVAVKNLGGIAVVQDPTEALVPSMPQSAVDHVKVDHCCKLSQMSGLLRTLAQDVRTGPPPVHSPAHCDELLQIEDEIASGSATSDEWYRLEKLAFPTDVLCPLCRRKLVEIRDVYRSRFRCRAGHAFTTATLFAAKIDGASTYGQPLGGPDAFRTAERTGQ